MKQKLKNARALMEQTKQLQELPLKIDLTGARMQTHASLSATRGILRLAEADNDSALLKEAVRVFGAYVSGGMTENYANFNWFSRPDTWTEPCAIVDSMMCALSLFRLTGDPAYARLANRIWYNGLGFAQRPNGGFGTDRCVGPAGDVLAPSGGGISEAYWCCTMRGAEGLRARADGSVYIGEGSDPLSFPDRDTAFKERRTYDIWLPFSTDADFSCDCFSLKLRSSLPAAGTVRLYVTARTPVFLTFHIYVPDEAECFRTRTMKLEAGGTGSVEETVSAAISKKRSADGRRVKYLRGDLLLGLSEPKDSPLPPEFSAASGGGLSPESIAKLRPINDMIDLSIEEAAGTQRRILF